MGVKSPYFWFNTQMPSLPRRPWAYVHCSLLPASRPNENSKDNVVVSDEKKGPWLVRLYGCFSKNRGGFKPPKMDGENFMENPMNKWMIWGYHCFWKHPYRGFTQLYRDYNKPWNKDPYKPSSIMESRKVFFVAQVAVHLPIGLKYFFHIYLHEWLICLGEKKVGEPIPWIRNMGNL